MKPLVSLFLFASQACGYDVTNPEDKQLFLNDPNIHRWTITCWVEKPAKDWKGRYTANTEVLASGFLSTRFDCERQIGYLMAYHEPPQEPEKNELKECICSHHY